ncbi:substrate-binding periplasmic protein [Zooshikella harenae]|uniref:Transporter substrate-binding domain-containing protein n=1 Tax=Zooshikella harenae TaxID=2827238 RepID=A0ABS5ZJF0_9GAMM|nr:transporter substrate-binding domain-containing protein [Zooshikella harenae]MBU2714089.1 transporter substrate-binding domain-containing protein [Zooshikella harenae]
MSRSFQRLFISIFLTSWISTSFSTEPSQQVEIYTYDILPPYAYHDDKGELTGIYIEITRTAISRMKDYSLVFRVVPWSRAKFLAQQGKAFAILPPYFHAHDWLTDTEPKRPYIWPYSQPLYTQHDVVICNKRVLNKSRSKWPDDFQSLGFVMFRGDGRAGDQFLEQVKEHKINLKLLNTVEDTVKALLLERTDCTVTSRLPFAWYLAKILEQPDFYQEKYKQNSLKLKEVMYISKNTGHLGYTDINAEKNFPFKKDFTIKFDIELYKMKMNGELDDIVAQFIDTDYVKQLMKYSL